MTSSVAVPDPGALSIGTDGSMQGRTGSYDKRLRDMRNVYRDSAAFETAVAEDGEDFLVYVGGTWVAPRSDIADGRWEEIAERARSVATLSRSVQAS